ncbi:MAG TPA: T9SS type A sorting domain-containing protein [Flavisolibacter sp.]|jgi:uncharacterized delta-60 repeat protein|nr:T9SS type A sorting domain-containing protein [Flavisolibacter sp.]
MRTIITLTLLVACFTSLAQDSSFQTEGFFLTNRNNAHIITASAQLPDGKILLSGTFLSYKGKVTTNLVRILPDGNLDTTFPATAGTDGVILKMAVQKDSSIVLTGNFTRYGTASTPKGIIRIKPNGDLDNSFQPWAGPYGYNVVQAIGFQSDGRILLAGFALGGGTYKLSVIRLNANGSLDNSFAANVGPDDTYTAIDPEVIKAITVRSDNKFYIGGSFTGWGGKPARGIVRLEANGTVDNSFAIPFPGFSGGFGGGATRVYAIRELGDSSLLVGGDFSLYGTQAVPGFCRIKKDGAYDTGFHVTGLFGGRVESLTLISDAECLIGGLLQVPFTTPIAHYNTNGTLIRTGYELAPDKTGSTTNGVTALYRMKDSSLFALGSFKGTYNGYYISQFQHFFYDLKPDTQFQNPLLTKGTATKTLVQADGKIQVIGDFDVYGNSVSVPRNNVARLNKNGSLDLSFANPDIAFGVYDIARAADGKTIIGGLFSLAGSTLSPGIVKLNADGTVDNSFRTGTGGPVYSLAVDSPFVYAGGDFDSFNGAAKKRVVRLNPDGQVDNSFTLAASPVKNATALTLQTDGKLLVGDGGRLDPGTEDYNQPLRIYRFDKNGNADASLVPPQLGTSRTLKIAAAKDTSIYWMGELRRKTSPSFFEYVVMKLKPNGSLAATTHFANDYRVSDFLILEDKKLLVCGQRLSNDSISYIYRLKPDLSIDSSFSPVSIYYAIRHLNVMPDGRILVAGEPARFLRQQQDAINNIALLKTGIFQVQTSDTTVHNLLDTVYLQTTPVATPVTTTFTLKNTSTQQVALDLNKIQFRGVDSTEFAVNLSGVPSVLNANDSAKLKVVFTPTNLNGKQTTIEIPYTNGLRSQFSFQISGKGAVVTAITDPVFVNPDLTVFPNPTTGIISIKVRERFDSYQLITMKGVLVQSGLLPSQIDNRYTIRLSKASKGMLLIRLMKKNKVEIQKVMVLGN